ncbi:MAG: response regulator transcription factor, partial [Synergistaceae bacterium]|nr:response regulator transcription factor [Synergistaceae bacterium]
MTGRGTILLVEDDLRVQLNNKEILERNGYTVLLAMDLAEARKKAAEQSPDAVVLDVTLPDGDGVVFLKELRRVSQIPVLILTASQTPEKATASFDSGGDDYLRKPYDLKEFRARVDAMMRRAALVPEAVVKGPLKLDVASGTAFLNGEDMLLAQKEFSLLLLFVQHEGRTISSEYLYEKVWNRPMAEDDSALKNVIYRLRKKLKSGSFDIYFSRN